MAIIKAVKHVPKFAPMIIPKQFSFFINLEDNKEIDIAVTPEDDCIIADDIHPIRNDLNFVLTDLVIK